MSNSFLTEGLGHGKKNFLFDMPRGVFASSVPEDKEENPGHSGILFLITKAGGL